MYFVLGTESISCLICKGNHLAAESPHPTENTIVNSLDLRTTVQCENSENRINICNSVENTNEQIKIIPSKLDWSKQKENVCWSQ